MRGKRIKKFVKSTAKEVERRIRAADTMLARGLTRTEIHQAFAQPELGGVTWRMAEIYVARARQRAIEALNVPKSEMVARIKASLESHKKDPQAKPGDRIRADQVIIDLLGLAAPREVRTEISGPMGGKIQLEQSVKQPIDYKRVGELARGLFGLPGKNGDSEPLHPAHADAEASPVPRRNGD